MNFYEWKLIVKYHSIGLHLKLITFERPQKNLMDSIKTQDLFDNKENITANPERRIPHAVLRNRRPLADITEFYHPELAKKPKVNKKTLLSLNTQTPSRSRAMPR